MKRIVLHVGRLVLRGVDRSDAEAVSDALQAELQRLLGPGGAGILAVQGSSHALQAGPVRLAPGAGAAGLGRAAAASIAGAGAREPTPRRGRP